MAQSVVDDHGEYKSSCGYCRSGARSSISHGMYARQMTAEDYQDLIDRGWRRSGNLLYKPAMDRTCCPPYTIRLDVNDFVPSKEQKAVLRRMERYLTGDYVVNEAPKGRPAGGRLSAGRETAPTEQKRRQRPLSAEGSKSNGDHVDTARKVTEGQPRLKGGSQAVSPDQSSSADTAIDESSKDKELRQGLPQVEEPEANHPQQKEHTSAKPSSSSEIDGLRSLVEQAVAQVLGSQCMVPVQVRRVFQKVRRKLSRNKQEGEGQSDKELIYTSNAAFLLAADSKKKGSNGRGPPAQKAGTVGVSKPSNQSTTQNTDITNSVAGRSSPELIGSADIAEALAQQLRMSVAGKWSVEACKGHLNFHAPVGRSESQQGPVVEPEGDDDKQHTSKRERVAEGRRGDRSETKTEAPKRKRFEMKMSRSKFDKEEYLLYRKYQIRVHNDAPNEVSETNYRRFLVDSPLMPSSGPASTSGRGEGGASFQGFGSFHQQYRIDGRLVAVGVVDILPHCLSSKYLFWDPDLAPLSLGKFSALKEVEWVRNGQRACPSLQYYYLGFYIHNCAKMRYKAAYSPSQLLCPLHYQWVPHSSAKHMLDHQAYADLCRSNELENGFGGPSNESGRLPHEAENRTGSGLVAGPTSQSEAQEMSTSRAEITPLDVGAAEQTEGAEALQKGSAKAMSVDADVGAPRKTGNGKAPSIGEESEESGAQSDGQESEESVSDEGMDGSDSSEAGGSEDSEDSGSDAEMQATPPDAATMDELETIPLLLVDTVIPFKFFHQLELMPEGAVRAVVARLQPYYAAVGPELASKLLYALG